MRKYQELSLEQIIEQVRMDKLVSDDFCLYGKEDGELALARSYWVSNYPAVVEDRDIYPADVVEQDLQLVYYGEQLIDVLSVALEEKPEEPKSNYAITGVYFYPKGVAKKAKQVKPSARGELEITTLNSMYLDEETLKVQLLGRGFAWLDTGTMESLLEASEFVSMVEQRQGIMISAPEEIAYRHGWISREELEIAARRYGKSPYGKYLQKVADGKVLSSSMRGE